MPMPIPIPQPGSSAVTGQPFYVRERQSWAIDQERYRHDQALYSLGEYALFFLMWSLLDFQAGRVARCSRCYGTAGSIPNRMATVYQQPSNNRCPDCYGTTFEGGYRAKIIRPSLWTDSDENEKPDRRGAVHPASATVETTWDFRMRQGDYIIRVDGSRWRLSAPPGRITLRSGYGHPGQQGNSITYSRIQVQVEEPGTVAYLLPPTDKDAVHSILEQPTYIPRDFASVELIRGPLIPVDGVLD